MKKQYTNYPEALRDIFNKTMDGEYVSRTFSYKFDEFRVVSNSLITNGTHKTYAGIKVAIINKTTGEIVNQVFPFKDYLRTSNNEPCKYIWESSSSGFIIWDVVPTNESIFEMNDAIDNWLALYR